MMRSLYSIGEKRLFSDPATRELLIMNQIMITKAKTHEDACFDRKSRGTRKRCYCTRLKGGKIGE
jgi:hypothetical protein